MVLKTTTPVEYPHPIAFREIDVKLSLEIHEWYEEIEDTIPTLVPTQCCLKVRVIDGEAPWPTPKKMKERKMTPMLPLV